MPELVKPFFKPPPPIRDKRHVVFVASLSSGCCECGRIPVQAHHLLRVVEKCMGRRSGDNWVIPVCYDRHRFIHRTGKDEQYRDLARALWENTGDAETCENLVRYFREAAV